METIKTEDDYNKAYTRLMEIFHPKANSPESDELEIMMMLVMDYDKRHYQ